MNNLQIEAAPKCRRCGGAQGPVQDGQLPCSCAWMKGSLSERSIVSSKALWIGSAVVLAATCWLYMNFRTVFPDNAGADQSLAVARDDLHNGNGTGAIRELQAAVALSPYRADLHYQLAQAFFGQDEPHQGLEQAKEAARLAPNDYEIQEVYAEALKSYGAENQSLEQFELVVSRFPKEVGCRQQAAIAYELAGKDDRAMEMWKQALKLDPEVPTGWTMLAKLAYRTGHLLDAESIITAGLKHNPDSPKLHFWHGLILTEQHNPDSATKEFSKAAELDSDYSELVAPYLEEFSNARGKNLSIVPLQQELGGLYVSATLNDELNSKMLIDSGATSCVISRTFAHRLGIHLADKPRVGFKSVTGSDEGIEVVLDSVKVAGFVAKHIPCIVYDKAASGADGILGMSFLSHFKFTVDPDVRQLVLVRR